MTTIAQQYVYDALTNEPLTPAEIKRRLSGTVPVDVIRQLLAQQMDRVIAEASKHHPGITGYRKA